MKLLYEGTEAGPGNNLNLKGTLYYRGKWFIGDYKRSLEASIQSFMLCTQLGFDWSSCQEMMSKLQKISREYMCPIVVKRGSGLCIGYLSYFEDSHDWLHDVTYEVFSLIMKDLLELYKELPHKFKYKQVPFSSVL